ncbi:MAG: hypothetical protein KGO96_12680 [Elusimicrobia bacterium]|nr:hypothetical protein [Elusimicrobiota bacterium]
MNLKLAEAYLRKAYSLPEEFWFAKWECFPKAGRETLYVEFTGGVPKILKSGPRKGRKTLRGIPTRTLIISTAEYQRIEADYIADTGNCPKCMGDGNEVSRIDFVSKETTWRPCVKCNGTGTAAGFEAMNGVAK